MKISTPILGTTHDPVDFAMPAQACDCHTHVFGPNEKYPFSADRFYTPGEASVEDLRALHRHLQIERVVVVHPSPYAADNACTLDALRTLGDRARGVAVIDETATDAELQEMHHAGVRGLRINLETGGVSDTRYAARQLTWASERVAAMGWHLQLYTNLPVIAALRDLIRTVACPVVVDHFCRAQANLGTEQPHFETLVQLVEEGKVWVKLSAPHRISSAPDCADAGVIAQSLIAANPDRMLWGSDWPHPGAKPGTPRRVDEIEAFNPINDGRALNRLANWVGDDIKLRKILVDNPASLYGFKK